MTASAFPPGVRMIGLTGGIASGKSTVSGMLRELGAQVIDADVVARQVVAPGTEGLNAVARRFPGVVDESGRLDRAKLGARIFGDDRERAALNAIVHPLIQAEVQRQAEALARKGARVIVYDAPLLIENGLHALMDGVILVAVPRAVQVERLVGRDGLGPEAAEARIASQLPLEEKRKVATWTVENDGPLEETRGQVERIWEAIHDR